MTRATHPPAASVDPVPRAHGVPTLRQRVRKAARVTIVVLLMVFAALAAPSTAWAQKKKKAEEEAPTKSYVGAYILVIFVTALGLMAVSRPSSRKDRVDEKKKDEVD